MAYSDFIGEGAEGVGGGIEVIYGAVTSGTNWRFLTLQGTTITIDESEYYINQIEQILGILLLPFQDLID